MVESEIFHGTEVGRFVVVGELGKGGMGVVYEAHDPQLDRRVALKVLRSEGATEEERTRMMREGQAMARITHPNVITVFEVGVTGHVVFLAQELLDGGTLGKWLEKKRTQPEIVDKFTAAGRGLAAAHAAGLVHRDFKPDNVLLGKDGRVRVADFGLARAFGPDIDDLPAATRANMARAQLELSRSPMSALTRTGAVMGTPMFMAPEQHNGEVADARSDQFAFCVALYHALYGVYPYPGKTAVALADAVIAGRLTRPPRSGEVPARLRNILVRGLATDRDDRYPTMDALLVDLTRPPSRRGRTFAIAAATVLLAGGAVAGGYAWRTHEDRPIVAPVDPKTLTAGRVEWLASAIERGQLDNATEKYDMAAAIAQQSGDGPGAAIARSTGALVLALRGHLGTARAHLKDAEALQGSDPTAVAYVQMATAAVDYAGGELDVAQRAASRCAATLAGSVPDLAALCHELRGKAAIERAEPAAARAAFQEGLAIANKSHSEAAAMTLELALAALDLDDGKHDAVIASATDLQAKAAARGAVGPETYAWILLSRAHIAQAATQQALADLEHVHAETIEPFQPRIEHLIALGQASVLLGDPDEGWKRLDDAVHEATKAGFPGLVYEARLARVEVLTATSAPDALTERRALVADARRHDYERIARMAEALAQP